MGFYYGPGSPPPDEDDDDKFHLGDAIRLVLAVFRVLLVPFTILIGGMIFLFILFWVFTVNLLAGYLIIGTGLTLLIGRAIWDSRHPKSPK